jgi:hypothetical protein
VDDDDAVVDCVHEWVVVRMVLDWRGTLFVHRCARCRAEAVEPASGDK